MEENHDIDTKEVLAVTGSFDNSNDDEAEHDVAEDDEPRGTKRPLQEAGVDDRQDLGSKTTKDYLPEGVTISWKDNCDLIATIKSDESGAVNESDERGMEPQICIIGRARLRCLDGMVEVLGHVLTPESSEIAIDSPFWSSWLTIFAPTTATTTTAKIQISSIRGSPSFRLVPPSRPTVIPPSWKTSVESICQNFAKAPPPARDSIEPDAPYHHPSDQIVVICGAKGVGKSTFLRYLNNRLLQSCPCGHPAAVAILDADVGQPELAPPGMLRLSLQRQPLLQPPYRNLCDNTNESFEHISAIFYGAVTSKVDPTRYIDAVQQLIQDYRDYLAKSNVTIPLLINLDGWIKGMGYEILTTLITSLKPSHVCQLLGDTKAKTFDLSHLVASPASVDDNGEAGPETVPTESTQLFFLDVCTKHVTPCTIPALTLRSLRLAAYFGPHLLDLWDSLAFLPAKQLQTGWSGDDECNLARYLAQERPYCVSVDAIRCSHSNEDILAEWHGKEGNTQLLKALNGGLVGLCSDHRSKCLGFGIVRSIDWKKRLLYILTPVTPSQLSNVGTLIGGNIPLPLPLAFRGAHAESFPYMTTVDTTMATDDATEGGTSNTKQILGSVPMKSRNNIGRRGFTGGAGGGQQGGGK